MRTIHLSMVKLKRDCQRTFPKTPFILAPNQERVVEHTAIHANSPVNVVLRESGSTYDHAFSHVMIYTAFSHTVSQPQIILVELQQTF